MTFKSLLVHVDNSKRCGARIDLAAKLAADFQAHLTGLHVTFIPSMSGYGFEGGLEPFAASVLREAEADKKKAAEFFEERIRKTPPPTTDWYSASGYMEDALKARSRYADLVIVGQASREENSPFFPMDFPALIALSVPRPVLVVPQAGTLTDLGHHALIAWNGSREATRAITDALPLLQRTSKVTIAMGYSTQSANNSEDNDLIGYLARHHVKANIIRQEIPDPDTAHWLLSTASNIECDLLVMGAYGHLRLRELVLGGTTRTLMKEMKIPILMSH